MDLRKRVWQFIEERDLLRPGDRVVVGVSGGPDSLCLLDVLHSLADDRSLTLQVAHLNHGLRPEAAEADAERVRAEAEKRGLTFHIETADTGAHARAYKQSIEEAARDLRYAFLTRVALAVGAPVIAVAHTADDQAETVLMHFLRGSGLAGLRGMLPKLDVGSWTPELRREIGAADFQPPTSNLLPLTLIRPLLTTSRAEVEAYCVEHSLQPVQDATNLDTTFFRNRLRHELLPQLERYNPNIRSVLRRVAEVMAGDYEILRGVVWEKWEQVARVEPGRVMFDRAGWLVLTVPEQRALLREAVARLRPGLRDIDFTPLEHAVQFSRTAALGRSCDVLGGLRLSISLADVMVSAWTDADVPVPADRPLVSADGQLSPGWRFCVEMLGPGEWSLDEVEANASGWQVCIDAARLPLSRRAVSPGEGAGGWGLQVRARLPGDRFQPLGLNGHSLKVSDFMINAKIEKNLRDRWPLVVCGDDIVWVAGLRLDERFKVTPETTTVLRLQFAMDDG
ncbi:MAG: tRNA(Ile)-lysidine synthase [Anaerolineales bacterium]|nr:tRNA(Ile)-lysidine synthase [Anaerolineales bacterium]